MSLLNLFHTGQPASDPKVRGSLPAFQQVITLTTWPPRPSFLDKQIISHNFELLCILQTYHSFHPPNYTATMLHIMKAIKKEKKSPFSFVFWVLLLLLLFGELRGCCVFKFFVP